MVYNSTSRRRQKPSHQTRPGEPLHQCQQVPLFPTLLEELIDNAGGENIGAIAEKVAGPAIEAPHDRANKSSNQSWESGRRYMTKAGIRVRSKAEKIIADYLTEGGLRFLYEPILRVGNHLMRPDFYLLDYDLPYEHFGLGTADYLRAVQLKMARYRAAGIPFIYTTFEDETDIEDVFVDKLAAATLDL